LLQSLPEFAPLWGFDPKVNFAVEFAGILFSVAVGDFNGDNRQDIVAAINGANAVSVLQGNCNAAPTPTPTPTPIRRCLRMKRPAFGDDELYALQRNTFDYFRKETNPENGLLADNTSGEAPASIAAVGYALAGYVVGVENSYIARDLAVERTLTTLRFFWNSPQGKEPDATGYKGFYYHFLDMKTGRRVWQCELSTIDTTILLAGALTAAAYFDSETNGDREIRELADALYRRVDWQWAQNGGATVTHGWKPERGFLKYRWEGYNEGFILYVLGLGSPTHPLPLKSYEAWTRTYRWKKLYGIEFLYAGPLFIHQLSHIW
jgi:hypothetical protein